MKNDDSGCGVFIKFLMSRIEKGILKSESLSFNENSRTEQLKFLRMGMYSDAANLPKTQIPFTKTGEMGWQVDELLMDSPLILLESLTPAQNPHPICQMSIYHQNSRQKNVGARSLDAEGSHKYPPRFLISASETALMPGYQKLTNFKAGVGLLMDVTLQEEKGYLGNDQDKINLLHQYYVEMFCAARIYKRNWDKASRDSRSSFTIAVSCFVSIVTTLVQSSRNLSLHGWLLTSSELVGLYNFYHTQLEPSIQEAINTDLSNKTREGYESALTCSRLCLSTFELTEKILNQQERHVVMDKNFFNSMEQSALELMNLAEQEAFKEKIHKPRSPNGPRLFISLPQECAQFSLNNEDIAKLTKEIQYQGTDNQEHGGCVLVKEECDFYNVDLMRYFRLKESDLVEAYNAVAAAMIPFAILLNDIVAFNHCDLPLLKRITQISDFLIKEFQNSFKALPKETKLDAKQVLVNALVWRALKETHTIFRNSSFVSEDRDTWAEALKALSTRNKILFGFGAAAALGLVTYGGFKLFSKGQKIIPDINLPLKEAAEMRSDPKASKELLGLGATTFTGIGVGVGIFVFGACYFCAEWYSQKAVKRRIYAELALECEANLPNKRLRRLYPIETSLKKEVDKYLDFARQIEEERKKWMPKPAEGAEISQCI